MPIGVLPRWLRPQSYKGLLTALLVLVAAQPMAYLLQRGQWVIDSMLALVLVSAIYETAGDRRAMRLALIIGMPAVIGRLLTAFWKQPPTIVVIVVFSFTILFLLVVLTSLMRHILTTEEVGGDTLRGAVCVYFLIGITWAVSYKFVFTLDPGAIALADHLARQAEGPGAFQLLTYFSFVTLTTLGYGDISPISPVVRSLAWLEAMAGQLFVAITIARLVGLYIAGRKRTDAD